MIYEKIFQRRTIRRFKPKRVPEEALRKCVDAARLAPSGRNAQPLKYVAVNDKALLREVFSTLKWAAYLPGYTIAENERPQAYIIMLMDTGINKDHASHDPGLAAMSICTVALDYDLGTCILANVDRPKLRTILKIPENLEIILVIALGYPAHKAFAEKMKDENDVKYWLDKDGNFHVPKRDLNSILKWNSY